MKAVDNRTHTPKEADMLRELERYYEDYCESIRQEAEKLRAEEMPEPTEDLFAIYENMRTYILREGNSWPSLA